MKSELLTRDQLATWPNVITLVRLLCIPLFLWMLFARDNRAGAAWLLAGLGSTDWVDGWIARRFHQQSEFGRLFDPAVDRAMFVVAIPALLLVDSLNLLVAILVLARELGVTLVAIWLDLHHAERLEVSYAGKTAAFLMMFALPMFLGETSTLSYASLLGTLAWLFALPGIFFGYYSLGWQYLREARSRIAAQTRSTE